MRKPLYQFELTVVIYKLNLIPKCHTVRGLTTPLEARCYTIIAAWPVRRRVTLQGHGDAVLRAHVEAVRLKVEMLLSARRRVGHSKLHI
jgi:hypothetical protein